MSGRPKRITKELARVDAGLIEIVGALRDGLQIEDLPAIALGVEEIILGTMEIAEVEIDIVAACRTMVVGREAAFDERLRARVTAQESAKQALRGGLLAEIRKAPNSLQTVDAYEFKQRA